MFRRRRADEADLDDSEFDEYGDELDEPTEPRGRALDDEIVDVVNPLAEVARPEVEETTGPWDQRDRPRDDDLPRVDLGGMRVPIPEGIELRVEVQDDVVVAAALVEGNSQLLVHAFAAPKSSGIWAEVRDEIADSLRQTGGSAEVVDGKLGSELRARIPDESGATQPARFIGVDGPRWFLRGLFTGPAATDATQAQRLEEVFRQVVVNRGVEAMAPRDMIPLHLPRDIVESAGPAVEAEPEAPTLQLRERGPEITEIQ